MNSEFAALAEQATEKLWKHQPIAATRQGVHRYDDRFAIFNSEYLNAFAEEADDLARGLRKFRDSALSPEEIVERDLLRGRLEIASAEIRDMERHTRSADVYISEIVIGLSLLVSRRFAPAEERATLVLERLRGVWRVLREGMANLRRGRNVPKVWTENGIHATEGALAFLRGPLSDFIESVESDSLREDLLEAIATARCAIEHYLNFLRLDMLASSKGRYAVGKDHYELLLKKRHGLDISVDEMVELGERLVVAARRRLEQHAIDRPNTSKSWRQLIAESRKKTPDPAELPQAYAAAMERARRFAAERGIVPSLEEDMPDAIWTPAHMQHVICSAYCAPAAPFDETVHAQLLVTPMEPTRTIADEERPPQSTVQCLAALPSRAASEGFPGRHLWGLRLRALPGHAERFHDSMVFSEGWTAYAREWMLREGFFETPDEELFALRDALLDAARLALDAKMHCEDVTLDEAIGILGDTACLEALTAERIARRHTIWPCEGACLVLGAEMIGRLRSETEERLGDRFDEKAFHQFLLGSGNMPANLVAKRVAQFEPGAALDAGPAKEEAPAAEAPAKEEAPAAPSANGASAKNGASKNGASAKKNGAAKTAKAPAKASVAASNGDAPKAKAKAPAKAAAAASNGKGAKPSAAAKPAPVAKAAKAPAAKPASPAKASPAAKPAPAAKAEATPARKPAAKKGPSSKKRATKAAK